MNKHRIVGLDIIRAISAILIVLYHYTTRYPETVMSHIDYSFKVPWGSCAVATFFILSGFFAVSHNDNDSGIRYLIGRAKRLYPAYWACLVLTFLVTTLFFSELSRPISVFLINLTMLQGLIGIPNIDGAYRTLAVEIVFYLTISVLVQIKLIKRMYKVQIVWIAVLYITAIILNSNVINGISKTVSMLLLNVEYGHLFLIGISLSDIDKHGLNRKMSWLTIILCIGYNLLFHSVVYTIVVGISVIAIIIAIHPTLREKNYGEVGRWFSFLAGISYPLYLIHQYIGYAILHHLEGISFTSEWAILLVITIMVILSTIIHYFVEIPAQTLFKGINIDKRTK